MGSIRAVFVVAALTAACRAPATLEVVHDFDAYPSASGIECLGDRLYVIGDDAPSVLVLDDAFAQHGSIPLYPDGAARPPSPSGLGERRMPKETKPDLEAATFTAAGHLLLMGSGSLAPHRNVAWLVDPRAGQASSLALEVFFARLAVAGIGDVNLEGAAASSTAIVLANRGHHASPRNHLVITSEDFWFHQDSAPLSVIEITAPTPPGQFSGISGLAYSRDRDRLWLTFSTEDTTNAVDDGAIGRSYLGVVDGFSAKAKTAAIAVDRLIDLDATDRRFSGHKVESVCVLREARESTILALAADDDDGGSTLFRVRTP